MTKFVVQYPDGRLVTQDNIPRSLAYDITNPSEEDGVIRVDTYKQAVTLQWWTPGEAPTKIIQEF